MRRFAVIGLGRFGSRLAANLAAAGQEVVAIDVEERLVEDMRDRVTLAVALDSTDEEALRMQGIDRVDVAIVGIGSNFQATCLSTVILKQIGVPRVISRAITPMAARILDRIGADGVVNPEDESADRWASRLISPLFLRQFELDAGHSIVEINAPKGWVGKNLLGLQLRQKLGLHVVAVRPKRRDGGDTIQVPDPQRPIHEGDTLVIMGSDTDLAALRADVEA